MMCSLCKKNEATVHLTQIIENKMQTIDLCESCSKAKGIDDPSGFSLASILLGLGTTAEAAESQSETELRKCPVCSFSQADFKKIGRLGCAECYNTFLEPLQGVLKSMHKGTKHCGKVPRTLRTAQDINSRIQGLQKKLDQAIASENFEEAALLRDQLKQTRKELNQIASS
jgi:protein arginine kinase activator